MAEEYFIRAPEDETARGPYGINELLTLAEADKLTPEFYYFDSRMESWAQIRTNEELAGKVFPEKKRLSLRKKTTEEIASINAEDEFEEAVKVDAMLAAAEGHTAETKHVRKKKEWEERTANLSVPVLGTMLLISAISVLYPSWNIIDAILSDKPDAWTMLFQNPVVFLGGLDLIMGVLLFLNATEVFPLIRFRAMLGAGFFATVYYFNYINGDPQALYLALSNLGLGIGLYVCTITLRFSLMVAAASIGIAGSLGIIWFSNLVPLLIEQ
jgi:hypothetical protein